MLYHDGMPKSLKRWPVLLALAAAFGALAVGLVCLPYGGRVTRANCERIKEGMTEAEVRTILGKPWDDSLLDPEKPIWRMQWQGAWKYGRPWIGDDFGMFVLFDDQEKVVHAEPISDPDRPRSWLPGRVWRRLRARYGW
jgi:hypothetical protein